MDRGPSHGTVWNNDAERAIQRYDSLREGDWGVSVAYASMYGNAQWLAERTARRLVERCARVIVHDASRSHPSLLVIEIWPMKGLPLAGPICTTSLFPRMDDLLRLLENKMLKHRAVGAIGSYTWSGGAVKVLLKFVETMHLDLVEPMVEAKCVDTCDHQKACENLVHL